MSFNMKFISEEYGSRIGYQMGDKILTYSTLMAYSVRTPSGEY
jgi:hypothetical protein